MPGGAIGIGMRSTEFIGDLMCTLMYIYVIDMFVA